MSTHGLHRQLTSRVPDWKPILLELISVSLLTILGLGIIGMEMITVWKLLHWYWIS